MKEKMHEKRDDIRTYVVSSGKLWFCRFHTILLGMALLGFLYIAIYNCISTTDKIVCVIGIIALAYGVRLGWYRTAVRTDFEADDIILYMTFGRRYKINKHDILSVSSYYGLAGFFWARIKNLGWVYVEGEKELAHRFSRFSGKKAC